MGGKWLFFISFRCDGVLGPRARGAGCKLRCETVPTESGRACWPHMGTDGPVYSDYPWLPASLVSSKASIVQSGLFSIASLRKKAVLESKLRGESSSGDHFYSSDQLWRSKIGFDTLRLCSRQCLLDDYLCRARRTEARITD